MLLEVLDKLQKIRNFNGETTEFWNQYLQTMVTICPVEAGIIALHSASKNEWHSLALQPTQHKHMAIYVKSFLDHMEVAWQEAIRSGWVMLETPQALLIGCPLILDSRQSRCLYLGYLPLDKKSMALQCAPALLSARDLYAQYRIRKTVQDNLLAKNDVVAILDLLTQLNTQNRFMASMMTLVNEIAARYKCSQASLGWFEKGYIKIKAISQVDDFKPHMEIISQLVLAMEESLEQDAEIALPTDPTELRQIVRAHQSYASLRDCQALISLPLRHQGHVVGVLTLERDQEINENELRVLRVALDQATPRLVELHGRDRWFGSRLVFVLRQKLEKLLGIEHTFWKALALLAAAFALFSVTIPLPYRVDAPVILRTKDIHFVTAPTAGYVDSVSVEPGDVVVKDQELLRLDRKELLLQEAELMAQAQASSREIQKAQAAAELALVRIHSAQLRQTHAQLSTTRFQLEQSIIRNPLHDAMVIESDLDKRSGAPVQAGDALMRIARIKSIFAEIDVPESEIENIDLGAKGEIALKSRPDTRMPIQVTRWIPSATTKSEGNIFLTRAEFSGKHPDWIRPGMTGVAKIHAGNRTLWWIISHSTLDFLRLKLWW